MKLIELRKENTFLNHLWNVFSSDMRAKGEVNINEIKVWEQNMWNKVFYPIFTFEFNSNNNLTNISDKLNPIGKVIIGIIVFGFFYLIFPKDVTEINLIDNWLRLTIIVLFALLVVSVARKVYRFEKKNQLEQIFETLDIETEEKKPEKEWSLKNILIRIFTYPFSIFIISICIWSLFENGIKSVFYTLFGVGVCGMYLYSDIKMIIKNKKTNSKK